MSEQSGADPMNEQTPADPREVIADAVFAWKEGDHLSDDILAALDAAGFRVSSKPDETSSDVDQLRRELDEYPTFMDLMEMQERLAPLADFLDALGYDHDAELVRRMLFPTGTVADLRAELARVSSKPDEETRREVGVPTDAHPVRYLFGPDELFHGDPMDTAHLADPIAINVTWRGGDRWAVERGHGWSPQMVWDDTDGEFVYEPLPSARSDEFKARTRYSLADAFIAARRAARVLGEVRSDG